MIARKAVIGKPENFYAWDSSSSDRRQKDAEVLLSLYFVVYTYLEYPRKSGVAKDMNQLTLQSYCIGCILPSKEQYGFWFLRVSDGLVELFNPRSPATTTTEPWSLKIEGWVITHSSTTNSTDCAYFVPWTQSPGNLGTLGYKERKDVKFLDDTHGGQNTPGTELWAWHDLTLWQTILWCTRRYEFRSVISLVTPCG